MSQSNKIKKNINFLILFKEFRFKIIIHWLLTIISTILGYSLNITIFNIIRSKKIENYSELISSLDRNIFNIKSNSKWNKQHFIKFFLLEIILYFLFSSLDSFLEEELQIKGSNYTKLSLIEKFHNLTFKQKQIRRKEINTLIGIENSTVGWFWNHIYNHIFHSFLTIFLVIINSFDKIIEVWKENKNLFFISLIWLSIVNLLNFHFLFKKIRKSEEQVKSEIMQENKLIEEESRNSILIDSMGELSIYRKMQLDKNYENENLMISFAKLKTINKKFPSFLINFYPLIILFFSENFSEKINFILYIFWEIYGNLGGIFQCFWDYSDYSSSLKRINDFLSLPQKDDNLNGIVIDQKIDSISFEGVNFSYDKEQIIKNYNNIFIKGKINKISSKNGTGKSTIIYLILGILIPENGKIMINNNNDLKDLNLQKWRKQISFCSHENLIEEGSTGQRQLKNINKSLAKESQVIILDEADNGLDESNKKELITKLTNISKKKIVIYISH